MAIIGGSGFVGTALSAQLRDRGCGVRIISRGAARPGLPRGVEWHSCPRPSAAAFAGCDCVVNLVGILNSRAFHADDFRRVHVRFVAAALAACKQAGVRRFLQMSALNASRDGPSEYLRTKGEAEDLVHAAAALEATSFRPSVIFGPGDGFLNRFAVLLKFVPGVFPLACAAALFAPVYVGDVARAVTAAVVDGAGAGRRIALCGPQRYTLREIVEYVASLLGKHVTVVPLPDFAARLQARVCEYVPGKPFSMDNYLSLQVDSVCDEAEPAPTRLEDVAPESIGAGR